MTTRYIFMAGDEFGPSRTLPAIEADSLMEAEEQALEMLDEDAGETLIGLEATFEVP
jgi:hypothetical protein